MQLTIFTANCRGRKSNTLYPKPQFPEKRHSMRVSEKRLICSRERMG